MNTKIKGQFRKYIFKSNNGYTVALIKVRETFSDDMKEYNNKTITITGYFHELNEDDVYIFEGEPMETDKYGFQFQVKEYERVKPEGKEGLIDFLSSDLFPGIGEKTAMKIVEELGDETLTKILESPGNITSIKKEKAESIHLILTKYESSHATIVYLCNLGFSMKDSLAIYNKYRENTMLNIDHNMYNILEDIYGISFNKVDSIAQKKGYELLSEKRIKAVIIYIMKTMCFRSGNVYLDEQELIDEIITFLKNNIETDKIYATFEILKNESKIIIENNKYYIKTYYDNEMFIANTVKNISRIKVKGTKTLDKSIETLQTYFEIEYNIEQKDAIKKAMENNFLIITGGPGTGKTTIIKAIVELYKSLNKYSYDQLISKIALLAPTGRAAKRMSEQAMIPACTIHRFLKWDKDEDTYKINEYNKSTVEFLIVDEVSMIDNNLFAQLLKGVRDNIKIVMVGDFNQLPSVAEGQVLRDLIESDVVNVVDLNYLYRQSENSYIIDLAHHVKDGELNEEILEKKDDYNFITTRSNLIKQNIKEICIKAVEKGYNSKDIQILAPIYRGENGIDRLNVMLQELFNEKDISKNEIRFGEVVYRENDKVLQLKNLPDENIFNGDIGIIHSINRIDKKIEIYINFDGNMVKYSPKDLILIKHGYAISVHKSQGSEYNMVIMPITNAYHMMLYRKLLYTGITRAKKTLILIGDPGAFNKGVINNNEIPRKTTLKDFLNM